MKKENNKKLLWQSILSLVILAGFICLASESKIKAPATKATHDPDTKEYTEIFFHEQAGAKYQLVRTGKTDEMRVWHGKVIAEKKIEGSEGWETFATREENYYRGYLHGKTFLSTINVDGGPVLKTYCYNMGNLLCEKEGDVKCDCELFKSAHIIKESSNSFEIFISKYPFAFLTFTGLGIEEEAVKAYVDTIETKLFKMEFSESSFNDKYDEVVGDMEYSSLDSVWQVHDQEAYNQGFYYLKFAEFRRAVVDAYRTGENNTYYTIKTNYPNYDFLETWIEYPQLKDSLFRIFCTDFDSLMASSGPLDIQDPFYIDSIEIRMLNSLVNLILDDESSSEASLLLKSLGMPKKGHSLSSFRKVALPVLEQIKADSLSGFVATYVVYTLAPHFYEGDKIRQAVREAYNLRKGIVTTALTTTEFLENMSSTSVQLRGFVLKDGGAEVTERGITWANYYNPTTKDNLEPSGADIGEYLIAIYGLTPGTTYYARSYATNSAGISYGNCISFIAGVTGIEDIYNPEIDFTLYPNPASLEINIDLCLETAETVELILVNMQGQIVFQKNYDGMIPGQNQLKINLSGFKDGTYNCKMILNEKEMNRKFLKINR